MPISDDSAWQLIHPVASFTKALLTNNHASVVVQTRNSFFVPF